MELFKIGNWVLYVTDQTAILITGLQFYLSGQAHREG